MAPMHLAQGQEEKVLRGDWLNGTKLLSVFPLGPLSLLKKGSGCYTAPRSKPVSMQVDFTGPQEQRLGSRLEGGPAFSCVRLQYDALRHQVGLNLKVTPRQASAVDG